MKRAFSIFSAVLALVFCLTSLPVAAAPVATASIGTVTAARGETVTVPVSITQVSGIGAIALHIRYDGDVLECVSAEAVGIMDQMDMNTANTEPQNHPNEVWLTGMGLNGMSGSGDLMLITFKVKDNAPAGMSALEFTDPIEQELILGDPIEALEMATTNGGVMVKDEAAPTTTEPPLQSDVVTTAAPTNPTTKTTAKDQVSSQTTPTANNTTAAPNVTTPTGGNNAAPDSGNNAASDSGNNAASDSGNNAASDSGNDAASDSADETPATEPTTVPTSVVVTREDGTEVTDKQGEPVVKDAVGISVGKATAKPGDTVTVNVSISAVSDLTAFGISILYDEEALEYVSGEAQGFLANMNFADFEGADGSVTIGGANPKAVSGEGVIATLTFKVLKKATSGEHTLKVDPESMLMADTIDLPFTGFDGAVTVEGGAAVGGSSMLYVVLSVAAAAILAFVIVLLARKKKAVNPTAAKMEKPKAEKPVLPTDISAEDGFDVEEE